MRFPIGTAVFFTVSLVRADAIKHLTFVYEPCKVPIVLSPKMTYQ